MDNYSEITTILNKNNVKDLCIKLKKIIPDKTVFALVGDLGTGKTYFSKNLISNYGFNIDTIISPTFNLHKQYQNNFIKINHFDLYRLETEQDVIDIGFYDYIYYENSITLIEWPEKIMHLLPDSTIIIKLFHYNILERKYCFKFNSKYIDLWKIIKD